MYRGLGVDKKVRDKDAACIFRALRCPTTWQDAEACYMVRAMQYLLGPGGGRLRPSFAADALKTAKAYYVGDLEELELILATSVAKGGRRRAAMSTNGTAANAAANAAANPMMVRGLTVIRSAPRERASARNRTNAGSRGSKLMTTTTSRSRSREGGAMAAGAGPTAATSVAGEAEGRTTRTATATAPATSHATVAHGHSATSTDAATHKASSTSRAPSIWNTAVRFEHHLAHEHAQSKVADSKPAHEHAMQLHKRPVFDDEDHGGARYSGMSWAPIMHQPRTGGLAGHPSYLPNVGSSKCRAPAHNLRHPLTTSFRHVPCARAAAVVRSVHRH